MGTDPMAENLNDIHDVEKIMPGFLAATVEWFKIYKMPDGKPANEFAFDGKPKDREFAENIIKGTHDSWKKLVNGETDGKGIVLKNSSLANAESMAAADAAAVISQAAEPGDALPLLMTWTSGTTCRLNKFQEVPPDQPPSHIPETDLPS